MSTFEHDGVTITLDTSGKFTAKVGTESLKSVSLQAMKKAIDKAKSTPFKPFKAYVLHAWSASPGDLITIVGIKKYQRHGAVRRAFIDSRNYTCDFVIPATPENAKSIAAYKKLVSESQRIADDYKKRKRELVEALPRLDPNTYGAKK